MRAGTQRRSTPWAVATMVKPKGTKTGKGPSETEETKGGKPHRKDGRHSEARGAQQREGKQRLPPALAESKDYKPTATHSTRTSENQTEQSQDVQQCTAIQGKRRV